MSPYKIGIKNRPLKNNGLYNNDPIYERLTYGNQTTINENKFNFILPKEKKRKKLNKERKEKSLFCKLKN